jgi:hypothetical protein
MCDYKNYYFLFLASISGLDIHKWLPYHNDAYLVTMNGSALREMFKISGQGITANENKNYKDWGQFLQVSSESLYPSS